MTNKQPWNDYQANAGYTTGFNKHWDVANWPYVVRWCIPLSDRLTRYMHHNRRFQTLAEAVAAYKRPFAGLSVDLVKYNGKAPGQHLDTLANRKACKPTKWAKEVPEEMRV